MSACSLDLTTSRGRMEAHDTTPGGGKKEQEQEDEVLVMEKKEVKRKT